MLAGDGGGGLTSSLTEDVQTRGWRKPNTPPGLAQTPSQQSSSAVHDAPSDIQGGGGDSLEVGGPSLLCTTGGGGGKVSLVTGGGLLCTTGGGGDAAANTRTIRVLVVA